MDLHFLQETPLFQGLTEQEIQAILPCLGARETPFGKGETLCRAEEILELVDKTEQELVQHPVILEGTVSICCGDLGGRGGPAGTDPVLSGETPAGAV